VLRARQEQEDRERKQAASEPRELEEKSKYPGKGEAIQAILDTVPDEDGRSIPVFTPAAMKSAAARWAGQERERLDRFKVWIEKAGQSGGRRQVPRIPPVTLALRLDELKARFPNFRQVLDFLRVELTLNMALPVSDFRIPPLLMVGAPGIGKTVFAEALATALGSTTTRIAASSQGGFELAGTAMHWGNAAPGKVFNALAEGESASPVLLLDELDKMGNGDERYATLPTLLALLEPASARHYEDQAVSLEMDASKAILAGTANDLSATPSPLLSRLHALEVQPPTPVEVRQIVGGMAASVLDKLSAPSGPITIPPAVLDHIARAAADLRQAQHLVRQAIGQAILQGRTEAQAIEPPRAAGRKNGMGFIRATP
jgi:ATP-dependent Lon protease